MGPMTGVIFVVCAAAFFGGVYVILRALGKTPLQVGSNVCPGCDRRNRASAKFCAHCGRELSYERKA